MTETDFYGTDTVTWVGGITQPIPNLPKLAETTKLTETIDSVVSVVSASFGGFGTIYQIDTCFSSFRRFGRTPIMIIDFYVKFMFYFLSFSVLFSAGGMGLYHGVDHYEKMKISDYDGIELFVKGWPDLLQQETKFRYDWSYIVSWVGVGMCLGSCILFFLAAMCIRSDKAREEAMNMQYLMPGR